MLLLAKQITCSLGQGQKERGPLKSRIFNKAISPVVERFTVLLLSVSKHCLTLFGEHIIPKTKVTKEHFVLY